MFKSEAYKFGTMLGVFALLIGTVPLEHNSFFGGPSPILSEAKRIFSELSECEQSMYHYIMESYSWKLTVYDYVRLASDWKDQCPTPEKQEIYNKFRTVVAFRYCAGLMPGLRGGQNV